MAEIEEDFYCINCSGETAAVLRPHALKRGGKLVVVREVRMQQCDACGATCLSTAVRSSSTS